MSASLKIPPGPEAEPRASPEVLHEAEPDVAEAAGHDRGGAVGEIEIEGTVHGKDCHYGVKLRVLEDAITSIEVQGNAQRRGHVHIPAPQLGLKFRGMSFCRSLIRGS